MDADIIQRLDRIEAVLAGLVEQRMVKEWYTTAEVGQILGLSGYTVREWARNGRIHAAKRACGRGRSKEWAVSHAELTRIRNEGLLPLRGQHQDGAA
jgi:excisionase family DNA binding protein